MYDLCYHEICLTFFQHHFIGLLVVQYPFYIVMVFDDWRNGIPVAFFFISRSREDDLRPMLVALHCNV